LAAVEDTVVIKNNEVHVDSISVSSKDSLVIIEDSSIVAKDSFNSDEYIFVKSHLDDSPSGIESDHPDRKKAGVNRSSLLVKQEAGELNLKKDDEEMPVDYSNLLSINEGTMFGVGGYRLKDTYLSEQKYGGIGYRFLNERMKILKQSNLKVSRQQIVNIEFSSTINGAENATFLSAFGDYTFGYHYRILPDPYFKLLVGGNMNGMVGMVYSTRNGNNPLTLHLDIDINFSAIAIYEFKIKKHHLALRYQFDASVAGFMFSPEYDQSYYEIFSLGNTAEIIKLTSLSNKLALKNYFTLDFPVGGMTVRLGYLGSFYKTNVSNIDRYIISNTAMLGVVKEFVAFGGREMRKRNLFHSAYY
jgi:hypothetical protein